jgi:hypothetical protein
MTDERLPSKGNVRFRFYPEGAFANAYWPLVSELNAGQELEACTLWDSFEVGSQASGTSDTSSIKAKSAVSKRAAAEYGGSASFWYPGDSGDMQNLASVVYDIMKEVNQPGYLVTSVDGEIGESGQPDIDFTFSDGDFVSVFKIITDEWTDAITGEEAFYYTRNFLKNGFVRTYTVASLSAPAMIASIADPALSVGDVSSVDVDVNNRNWTRGANFKTSDPAIVTVSPSGVVKAVSAGSATVTVELPGTSPLVTRTVAITVE